MPNNDIKKEIIKAMEWTSLDDTTLHIDRLKQPNWIRNIDITRDSEYRIDINIFGDNNKKYAEIMKLNYFPEIKIINESNTSYEFKDCYIKSGSEHHFNEYKYEIKLGVSSIKKNISLDDISPLWLTEWYLNGSNDYLFFPKTTKREINISYLKDREVTKKEVFNRNISVSLSQDYAKIKMPDFSFIIYRIPKEISPKWSTCIGIEYRKNWGKIPTYDERKKIGEFISFIMGRELLSVGYTVFNKEGYPFEEFYNNPISENVVSRCEKNFSYMPILFDLKTNTFELILSNLLPKYLNMRSELKLNEVLWRGWLSDNMFLETTLPILSNAIEILSHAWFKSTNTKSKGFYIKQDDFLKTISDELINIGKKIFANKYKYRILNRIKNACFMGTNEKLEIFFSEIGLKVGKIEKEAIKARNKMAHASLNYSKEEIKKLMELSIVYRTLLIRTILKILDYKGRYIDYYRTIKLKHKYMRNIDDPIA